MRSTTLLAHSRLGHKAIAAAMAAGALVLTVGAGTHADAAGSTACNPVTALKYKGDATTSDTGVSTITVSYAVKSCNANPVTASISMYETATPSIVVYANANASLSGKFTVAGVKRNFSYSVAVTVTDQVTGAIQGSKTIFAAARYTGV